MSIDIEIHHFIVSGELVCLSVTCLQRGGWVGWWVGGWWGGKKGRGLAGLGFLSRVSLQPRSGVSFPPSPFELLALGQVTKQDSITGR